MTIGIGLMVSAGIRQKTGNSAQYFAGVSSADSKNLSYGLPVTE
jgi:hypothetical protein